MRLMIKFLSYSKLKCLWITSYGSVKNWNSQHFSFLVVGFLEKLLFKLFTIEKFHFLASFIPKCSHFGVFVFEIHCWLLIRICATHVHCMGLEERWQNFEKFLRLHATKNVVSWIFKPNVFLIYLPNPFWGCGETH